MLARDAMFLIQNIAENSLVPDWTCLPSVIFDGFGIQDDSSGYAVFKRLRRDCYPRPA